MKNNIYILFHKRFSLSLQNDIFYPMHLGKELSNIDLGFMGDNTGDNISKKNNNYCELTAMYWVWKNMKDLDYVGFYHYRRFLLFPLKNDIKKFLSSKKIFLKSIFSLKSNIDIRNFIFSEINPLDLLLVDKQLEINNFIKEYDLLLPKSMISFSSMYQGYCRGHIQSDLDKAIVIIQKKYPDFQRSIDSALFSNNYGLFNARYYCNLFIMKKDLFDSYMERLFSILFELEKEIDLSDEKYKGYQGRVFGFLAERLFNVYIDHIKRENNIKIKELDTLLIL